jgi:hypothetical protein
MHEWADHPRHDVTLATADLLARVIASRSLLSVVFTDALSITPADALAPTHSHGRSARQV